MDELLQSFEIAPELLPATTSEPEKFAAFKKLLIQRIEELAEKDMEKLMWVLYRIDVNEKKLHQALANASPADFSETIANLVIERQLQKAESRKQNSEGGNEWNFDI